MDVLDELKRLTIAFEASARVDRDYRRSVLRLAVRINLLLYVDQLPDCDVLAESGILWDALLPSFDSFKVDKWDVGNPELTGLPIITKLLEKGCSLNDIWTAGGASHETAWQHFVMRAQYALTVPADQPPSALRRNAEQQLHKRVEKARIVTFLLEHGADPDAKYEIDDRVPGRTARSYETRDFLMQVFDGDKQKVDALRNEARKTRSAAVKQKQPGTWSGGFREMKGKSESGLNT